MAGATRPGPPGHHRGVDHTPAAQPAPTLQEVRKRATRITGGQPEHAPAVEHLVAGPQFRQRPVKVVAIDDLTSIVVSDQFGKAGDENRSGEFGPGPSCGPVVVGIHVEARAGAGSASTVHAERAFGTGAQGVGPAGDQWKAAQVCAPRQGDEFGGLLPRRPRVEGERKGYRQCPATRAAR